MLSRFFLNNINTKMLAPHAVDIAVTILTLIASLCFTMFHICHLTDPRKLTGNSTSDPQLQGQHGPLITIMG